jgi:hypothetical protein
MQELGSWIWKQVLKFAKILSLILLACLVTYVALVAVGGVILGGFFLFGSPHAMWILVGVYPGEPYAPMAVFSACIFLGSVVVTIAGFCFISYEIYRQLGSQIAGCIIDNWGRAQRIVAESFNGKRF